MEKLEWREAFNRQPIYILYFDLRVPMSLDNINLLCQVLQNTIALSNSLKGTSRISVLGIYALSERIKCVFPLQSVKYNFSRLQSSLESMQSSHTVFRGEKDFEVNTLTEILQESVKQYESYFQGATYNREEWPQLQMIFFSAQAPQIFSKMVQKALRFVHLPYISKVEVVIMRKRGILSSTESNSSKSETEIENSPILFGKDDTDDIASSLLHISEIDANEYQIECLMKQWFHDNSSDSDHLRLTIGEMTLRCDTRECLLSPDVLPATGQYSLFPDAGASQYVARSNPTNKQQSASKFPIYSMDAVAVIQKDGICESLLFGHSYIATATRCWKIDWDDLDRNEQLFLAVTRYLREKGVVLMAKKQSTQILSTEKVLPTGFFMFFPGENAFLVKSVASSELILPTEEVACKEVADEVTLEVKKCIDNLEYKMMYNPHAVRSGLYLYLNSYLTKKNRPSTSFVTPIIAEGRPEVKKRKKSAIPVAEVSSTKKVDKSFDNDFITASSLLKRKFSSGFE